MGKTVDYSLSRMIELGISLKQYGAFIVARKRHNKNYKVYAAKK